jgi:hypothetical protein
VVRRVHGGLCPKRWLSLQFPDALCYVDQLCPVPKLGVHASVLEVLTRFQLGLPAAHRAAGRLLLEVLRHCCRLLCICSGLKQRYHLI